MDLPPLGQVTASNEADVIACLGNLAQEATDERSLWEQGVEDNQNIFVYGAIAPPDDRRIIVPEIRNAIIAATDIQTKEPPQVALAPVETGEPPEYFWAGPDYLGIQLGLAPDQVSDFLGDDGQMYPPNPIDPIQAGYLKAMAVPEEASPALMPGMIRPEWLVEFNDQLVADTYQTILDVLWERSEVDQWVRENLLDTNIQGWADGLYQFDDDAKRFDLRHLPITQVYVDPTARGIKDAQYAGFDLPLDADQAKRMYPDLAPAIDAEAQQGQPQLGDRSVRWGAAYDRSFMRPIVVFRVFWLRDQPIPLSKDEAVAAGLVEERVSYANAADDPNGAGATGAEAGHESAEENPPDEAGGQIGSGDMPLAGGLGGQGLPAPAPMVACYLPGTDQPVMPGDPAWPTRPGIRQITLLANRLVDDRECPFADIPLLRNINIPLPGNRPHGIGEPQALRCLQDAESRLLNSMVEHAEYFAHPVTTISESMQSSIGERAKDMTVKPGLTMIVPDDQWNMVGGKILAVQDPPPLSPAATELFPILKNLIAEESGHAEVLQGRASSQVKSGKAIELLQTAASSMIGFKSHRTGDMVRRLAILMLHDLVHRLTPQDVRRIVSKYPPHVIEAICDRARSIEWNVRVTVQAGNGGLQLQKRQQAAMDRQLGAISLQTYQEKAGLDPRQEKQRMTLEMQQQARLAAAMGPRQPGEGRQEGGGSE